MNRFENYATAAARATSPASYGSLPEWNLDDLYEGMKSPALKADLARADADSVAFEERYKGKLGEMAVADDAGKQLVVPVREF